MKAITNEYNDNQILMKDIAKIDYTAIVVNNIWTKICVIQHNDYRIAVVSHGAITFTLSLSFRYSQFVPLIYNITRRQADNIFEEMVGIAVIGTTAEPNRLFSPMYAMRSKQSSNESRIDVIIKANGDKHDENVIKAVLSKLDELYLNTPHSDSNEWIEIQYVTK